MTPQDIRFRDDVTVELIDSMGDDRRVVQAARVSTGTDLQIPEAAFESVAGLIRYLMKHRHGSPFEHAVFQFRIECPKFVTIEFMRHRIASYNEESGRYKQLDPVFWLPAPGRKLLQGSGKPGHYELEYGNGMEYVRLLPELRESYTVQYRKYERLLERGYAREVARAILPFGIYTSFYVTFNARAMMNFLSLRVDDETAMFPTKPQYEIQQVALDIEAAFEDKMPLTHEAFVKAGRVAP